MRTYLLSAVFVVACLIPSALLISGYGKPAILDDGHSTSEPPKSSVVNAPTRSVVAENDPTEVANDDAPKAQNPLIQGVQQLLGQTFNSSELDDQRDALQQSLNEADTLLTKAKRQNRDAMRQANRQVRIRGPQSPNVVFILASDLGSNDLGCYGGTNAQTPNIDRLATGGVRFTNFYAGSHRAAASRWTLMTGLHTGHASRPGEGSVALNDDDFSLPEVMWQGGYATGAVGLWNLPLATSDSTPNDQGFDEWLGFRDRSEASELYPQKIWSDRGQVKVVANADGKQGASATQLFTQEALSFIDRRHQERPFFLMLSYPAIDGGNDAQPRAEKATTLDANVGRIVEHLRQLGIYDHTIIVLTSDNELNNADAVVRTPLIINGPGPMRSGVVSEHVAAMWDLYPTFAEMTFVHRWPNRIDGLSLYREVLGERQPEHRFLAWNFDEKGQPRAARLGKWMVKKSDDNVYRVYDLATDIEEQHNVAAEHPEVIEEFERVFAVSASAE